MIPAPAGDAGAETGKRTKGLWQLLDRCHCWLRDRLLGDDPRRLVDGTQVPVCEVSRVGRPNGSGAGRQWHEHGAEIGRCAAPGWWFYGFKLVLTATVDMQRTPQGNYPPFAYTRTPTRARIER
jgi:hypothetical protein